VLIIHTTTQNKYSIAKMKILPLIALLANGVFFNTLANGCGYHMNSIEWWIIISVGAILLNIYAITYSQ
jgi:hypothetical protein